MLLPNDPLHARWADAAAALGLGTFLPIGAFDLRATFKTMKRCLGTKAPYPSAWSWMFGKRGGTEVLVAAQVREPSFLTSVVARIDPPLFLGIEAWRQANALFEGRSWAPARMTELFARAPTALMALGNAPGASTTMISDSTVIVNFPQIEVNATTLAYALDTAAGAASALVEARRNLPKSEGERTQEATWQSFATEHSLRFDADRLELSGTYAGAKIRIVLEGEPFCAMTTVDVDFPSRLELGLSITRQRLPSFVRTLMGNYQLSSGDVMFDESFGVRAQAAVRAQQLLWNPALRRTIAELGLASRAFELTDGHLFAQYVTPMATTAELRGLCERIGGLVGALFPGVSAAAGPYR